MSWKKNGIKYFLERKDVCYELLLGSPPYILIITKKMNDRIGPFVITETNTCDFIYRTEDLKARLTALGLPVPEGIE